MIPEKNADHLCARIATASQDADVLRNVLMIATWHYTWNIGNLQGYQSTFQAHKVGSLQRVRSWIECDGRKESALKAERSIATHCIVDV